MEYTWSSTAKCGRVETSRESAIGQNMRATSPLVRYLVVLSLSGFHAPVNSLGQLTAPNSLFPDFTLTLAVPKSAVNGIEKQFLTVG